MNRRDILACAAASIITPARAQLSLTGAGSFANQRETGMTPKAFGAKADGSIGRLSGTDDADAIQRCIAASTRPGACVVEFDPGEIYYIGSTVNLPTDRDVIVHGNGAAFVTSQPNFALFSRTIADQSQFDATVSYKIAWRDSRIYASGAGQVGIVNGATYQSIFDGIEFFGCDTGLDIQGGLQTSVRSCMATNCSRYGFVARDGQWTGAGRSNAQSNRTSFQHCRNYALAGMTAGFFIQNAADCSMYECITEGGNPIDNIVFNQNGSIYGKGFYLNGLHSENNPTNAIVKIIGLGGDVKLERIYAAFGDIIVDSAASIDTNIIVEDLLQSPVGKFRHAAGSVNVHWMFRTLLVDPRQAATWDIQNGIRPSGNMAYWIGADRSARAFHVGTAGSDPGNLYIDSLLLAGAGAYVLGLPTSDPHIFGKLWNNSGAVMASLG